jgi:hypothetical protein
MSVDGCRDHQVALAATQVSISEVAKLMQTELHRLLERRCQIRLRTRDLERVLLGLRNGVGRPPGDDVSTAVQLPASRRSRGNHKVGDDATALHGDSLGSDIVCKQDQASYALRRACRIALLEVGGPSLPAQIYSRIARRGSFTFTNHKYAMAAIVRMLNVMAKEGEINTVDRVPPLRWELISGQETWQFNS